jgi:Mg/Co/Ni transporter MgtE
MTSETAPPSILKRRFSEAWVGLALSIVAALVMFFGYTQADRPDPQARHTSHQDILGNSIVVSLYAIPAMVLALLAFAVGLGTLIPRLARRQNVAIPAVTVALCALSFGLFAALWFGR